MEQNRVEEHRQPNVIDGLIQFIALAADRAVLAFVYAQYLG